jgi:methylated-DNA-[protein]-cysteine S-methyltransferase
MNAAPTADDIWTPKERPRDDAHHADDAVEQGLRGFRPELTPPDQLPGWPPPADVHYVVAEMPIGRMMIATRSDGALLSSTFLGKQAEERSIDRLARALSPGVVRGGKGPQDAVRQLQEYLAGRRREFELQIDDTLATPFQRLVLHELAARVPYGETTSYGALAAAVGKPGAARAVGSTLGANPLCVVIPCHRVLAGSGSLNGYAGGPEAKRFLLELEGSAA